MSTEQPFLFDMVLDDHGVLCARIMGQLDAGKWLERRKQLVEEGLTGEVASGRPLVLDLRASAPPDNNWNANLKIMVGYLREIGEVPSRRAYVVSPVNQNAFALRLFQGIEEGTGVPMIETRMFTDYQQAYDWCRAALRPEPTSDDWDRTAEC
jgi:hypothetical protein